jgi:hypothetical protein
MFGGSSLHHTTVFAVEISVYNSVEMFETANLLKNVLCRLAFEHNLLQYRRLPTILAVHDVGLLGLRIELHQLAFRFRRDWALRV